MSLNTPMELFLLLYLLGGMTVAIYIFDSTPPAFTDLLWLLIGHFILVGFNISGLRDARKLAKAGRTHIGFTPWQWLLAPALTYATGFAIGIWVLRKAS